MCSQAALKQRKYRAAMKSYRNEDSAIALQIMKGEPQYKDIILDIGLDPFYLFFAVPLQKEYLLDCTQRKRVTLSMDATGISVKPPPHSSVYFSAQGAKHKKCFLYLISVVLGSVHVPIFQIVSQRHSHDFIAYILLYFKQRFSNGKSANEVLIDDSAALLLSNILVFTGAKSLTEYLNQCYDALFNHGNPPACYIRLDRAHFVNSFKSVQRFKRC